MRKGQITIFFALTFSLILSLFLSALETARSAGLRLYMECAMESSLNSAFAQYNRELLERYDVFFLDLSYNGVTPSVGEVEGRLCEYMEWNLLPADKEHFLFVTDFYDVEGVNATVTGMRFASDDNGDVFRNQAVHYMKQFIGLDELEDIQSWIKVTEEKEISGEEFQTKVEQAKADWDSYKLDEIWDKNIPGFGMVNYDYLVVDSITQVVTYKDLFHLSYAKFDSSKALSFRKKAVGSEELSGFNADPTEELFFNEYLISKFGNYKKPKEDTVLKYELEYILCGMEKDNSNFETVVHELCLFRSAANICSLYLDTENTEAVRKIAEAISAVTKVPEPVITAILFIIWAEAEAAVDLRTLLDGGKVPLIKRVPEFAVSLEGAKKAIVQEEGDQDKGLSYVDHLRVLLNLVPPKWKAYRAMDLIEINVRSWTGNDQFRMDACLDGIKVLFSIESGFGYRYTAERSYYYLS